MTVRSYIVRQGDCLTSLAARFGTTEDALWSDDHNTDLRGRRPDRNVLGAGDVVHVPAEPPPRPKVQSGGTHRFKAYGATTKLLLDMQDPTGDKMAGKHYRLRVGARVIEGQTTSEGRIEARVPTSATAAELTVWPTGSPETHDGVTWTVLVGHMDPHGDPSGTAARLENLGIEVPSGPGGLESAVRTFQARHGIEPTGTLDDATLGALRTAAGV